MKKIFILLSTTLLIMLGCEKEKLITPVDSVSMEETMTITVGESKTLVATVSPKDASQELVWTSTDSEIASVDQNGLVKALKVGSVAITAKEKNGGRNAKYADCAILVKAIVYPVENVTLDVHDFELFESESKQLTATVSPQNATNKEIIWSSSNFEIATVDAKGLVTAIIAGTAVITASTKDGNKTANSNITVKASIAYVDAEGVNHGDGVTINEVVWAPVNCGYHETNFKYGMLYQWGNKIGLGYKDSGTEIAPIIDNGRPEIAEEAAPNTFYKLWDWHVVPNGTWGGDDEITDPIRTKNDPCPIGWRVPNKAEFEGLKLGGSDFVSNTTWSDGTTSINNLTGRWLGVNHATASSEDTKGCIFLPAGGTLFDSGSGSMRSLFGAYWSTGYGGSKYFASDLYFGLASALFNDKSSKRNRGFNVRCVKVQQT